MKLQHEAMKTVIVAALIVVALVVLAQTAAAQTPGRVTRESVDSLGGEALGESGAPALSADGRFVGFQSDAADLVPNDTNQDTDVFVRDRQTGVVERVSIAWNGMEARDDSGCPALSADGRYVAFLSRAWNLYPGGANLGKPRWDVHLHDRQDGTTTRISRTPGGGDPDGDSGCPSISGDGGRIVFYSGATNLVGADGNGLYDVFLFDVVKNKLKRISKSADGGDANGSSLQPVISRNGRYVAFESRAFNLRETGVPLPPLVTGASTVFVRDLDAGITEAVSLKDHDDPPYSPQEDSYAPSISDDGRYVAFVSEAWNLVLPSPATRWNVFVRDRVAGHTILASPSDVMETDCGRDGLAFPCRRDGIPIGRIAGDGRFVAFSSRSLQLLPANLYHGDQIYLFDVQGRRLRRVSVEPDGWESDSCSVEPVLSADARVLAYRSTATNLVVGDQNQHADVFAQDWTGDGSAPVFPDPAAGANYQLCVYARSLALDVAAAEGPACGGGTRPCWQPVGGGYKLIDPNGALTSLRLTAANGTPRIQLHGAGSLLDAPYLPLLAPDGFVVQLQETSTGRCWGSELPASSIAYNVAGPAQRGTARNGKLVAQLR